MAVRYDPATYCTGKEQVGLQRLRDWTLQRWGGINAGIYSCRTVRGGIIRSIHSEGRAYDWQPRQRAHLLEAINIVIANADKLAVQYLADYVGKRTWLTARGWAPMSPRTFGYGTLPNWHCERNWDGARDARTIEQIIGKPPTPTTGELDVVLTGQKSTIKGRVACASIQGRQVLLWNGATCEGDKAFSAGLRVWEPPQPHPLLGVDVDRYNHLVVALAKDGGTFAAKLRAGTY